MNTIAHIARNRPTGTLPRPVAVDAPPKAPTRKPTVKFIRVGLLSKRIVVE